MSAQPTAAQVEQMAANVTGRELHKDVMRAAESGHYTILDLFDHLPWRGGADWTAWRAFLCALYGLPMTQQEYAIYRRCTGRADRPTSASSEAWLPVGRRARKTAVVAVVALFNAAYRRDYKPYLAPGEVPTVPILAKDKYEAKQAHGYIHAILQDPRLNYLLDGEPTAEEIRLKVPGPTGEYPVSIIVRAATITAARSRTVLTAVLDEVAFFRSEDSAQPDVEILRGLMPGMANIPGAMVLGLSSPFAPAGLLYEKHKAHWGKAGPVLVWQAPTLAMHDTPQIRETVDKAMADDAIAAKAEYGAEFRQDMVGFVTDEVIDACTVVGRKEIAPKDGVLYFGFVDASGGAGDSFALGIAHVAPGGRKIVLDLIREKPAPFDPKQVVKDWAPLLKGQVEDGGYALRFVTGDYYAGEWVGSEFRSHGIGYVPSEMPKSEIFGECLPQLNSRQVELLDIPRIRAQFVGLVRRVSAGGKETISKPPGGHDDVANAVAGALVRAAGRLRREQKKADEQAANPPPKDLVDAHNQKLHQWAKRVLKEARHGNGRGDNGGGNGRASGL